MAKRYETKGFVQNMDTMKMLPANYEVYVSKDTHTTMTFAIKDNNIAYCIDISQIVKDLVNKANI